jgi:DNA-binding transcriptional ArsR family regulator
MKENFSDQKNIIEALAEELDIVVFRALTEPCRIDLIKFLLAKGPSDIETISQSFTQDRSVISRHLKQLLEAGLVSCLKNGKHRIYQLNGTGLISKFENILRLAKQAVSNCCPIKISPEEEE